MHAEQAKGKVKVIDAFLAAEAHPQVARSRLLNTILPECGTYSKAIGRWLSMGAEKLLTEELQKSTTSPALCALSQRVNSAVLHRLISEQATTITSFTSKPQDKANIHANPDLTCFSNSRSELPTGGSAEVGHEGGAASRKPTHSSPRDKRTGNAGHKGGSAAEKATVPMAKHRIAPLAAVASPNEKLGTTTTSGRAKKGSTVPSVASESITPALTAPSLVSEHAMPAAKRRIVPQATAESITPAQAEPSTAFADADLSGERRSYPPAATPCVAQTTRNGAPSLSTAAGKCRSANLSAGVTSQSEQVGIKSPPPVDTSSPRPPTLPSHIAGQTVSRSAIGTRAMSVFDECNALHSDGTAPEAMPQAAILAREAADCKSGRSSSPVHQCLAKAPAESQMRHKRKATAAFGGAELPAAASAAHVVALFAKSQQATEAVDIGCKCLTHTQVQECPVMQDAMQAEES